jgi:hypothetical protein
MNYQTYTGDSVDKKNCTEKTAEILYIFVLSKCSKRCLSHEERCFPLAKYLKYEKVMKYMKSDENLEFIEFLF